MVILKFHTNLEIEEIEEDEEDDEVRKNFLSVDTAIYIDEYLKNTYGTLRALVYRIRVYSSNNYICIVTYYRERYETLII